MGVVQSESMHSLIALLRYGHDGGHIVRALLSLNKSDCRHPN